MQLSVPGMQFSGGYAFQQVNILFNCGFAFQWWVLPSVKRWVCIPMVFSFCGRDLVRVVRKSFQEKSLN